MPGSVSQVTDTDGVDAPSEVKVWDAFVRLFHWSLVCAFTVAWLSAEEWDTVHEWAGYTVAALVGLRIVWGIVGSSHARFVSFVRGPQVTLAYLRSMLRGREERYLGHNPAGAAMIVALLLGLSCVTCTGWMMTLDRFWGVAWVDHLHGFASNGLIVLAAAHVGGVVYASWRHGENLAWAMITGRKRGSTD